MKQKLALLRSNQPGIILATYAYPFFDTKHFDACLKSDSALTHVPGTKACLHILFDWLQASIEAW